MSPLPPLYVTITPCHHYIIVFVYPSPLMYHYYPHHYPCVCNHYPLCMSPLPLVCGTIIPCVCCHYPLYVSPLPLVYVTITLLIKGSPCHDNALPASSPALSQTVLWPQNCLTVVDTCHQS